MKHTYQLTGSVLLIKNKWINNTGMTVYYCILDMLIKAVDAVVYTPFE